MVPAQVPGYLPPVALLLVPPMGSRHWRLITPPAWGGLCRLVAQVLTVVHTVCHDAGAILPMIPSSTHGNAGSLHGGMSLKEFDNACYYAAELKSFAREVGINAGNFRVGDKRTKAFLPDLVQAAAPGLSIKWGQWYWLNHWCRQQQGALPLHLWRYGRPPVQHGPHTYAEFCRLNPPQLLQQRSRDTETGPPSVEAPQHHFR